MAHPFSKMFDAALRKSTLEDNVVLEVAEKLKAKGYRPEEIYTVLEKLRVGLIDDGESEIVSEAAEEFSRYLDIES